MKKYTFSIIFSALSAVLLFLAACGEGEPVDLATATDEWGPIGAAIGDLRQEIGRCANPDTWSEDCPSVELPPEPPSSITEYPSSDDHENPYSSDDDNPYSSPGEEDSSSSEAPPVNKDEICPDNVKSDILGKFTCKWTPAAITAGKDVTLNWEITDPNCLAGTAEKKIHAPNSVTKFGIATFNNGELVHTSEPYPHIDWATDQPIAAGGNRDLASQWPTSGTFDKVYGLLNCGEFACSKECEPLTINEAGKPNVTGVTLSCPWTVLTAGTKPAGFEGNLAIGSILGNCSASGTVTNAAELDGCGDGVYVEYCGGATPASCNVASAGDLEINAAVKCKLGGVTRLKTLKYRVVPNPTLSGTCGWSKNPVAASQGAIPSGVSLDNSYGRCGISDGALPTTAYGGNGIASWPTTGIVEPKTYNAVKTNLSCIPSEQQKSCPTLEVYAGCTKTITALNTVVSVPNGDCFDVRYTIPNSVVSDNANGLYVVCATNSLGAQSSSCLRLIKYGSQIGTREGSCEQSVGNNTNVSIHINNSEKFSTASEAKTGFKQGDTVELEGITPYAYANLSNSSSYFNYECKGNDYSNGAIWTAECNGATLVTLKPNVTLPASSLHANPLSCKLKVSNSNWEN